MDEQTPNNVHALPLKGASVAQDVDRDISLFVASNIETLRETAGADELGAITLVSTNKEGTISVATTFVIGPEKGLAALYQSHAATTLLKE